MSSIPLAKLGPSVALDPPYQAEANEPGAWGRRECGLFPVWGFPDSCNTTPRTFPQEPGPGACPQEVAVFLSRDELVHLSTSKVSIWSYDVFVLNSSAEVKLKSAMCTPLTRHPSHLQAPGPTVQNSSAPQPPQRFSKLPTLSPEFTKPNLHLKDWDS